MLPLEVQIDAMSQVRSQLIMMRDGVRTGDFKNIGGPMTEYGEFDTTPLLSHHYELAHGVVLEGLETMVKSIDTFYDSLLALQQAVGEVDDDSAAAQHVIATALNDLDVASHLPGFDSARERYRDEHGDAT
jgi:hypothetical protein